MADDRRIFPTETVLELVAAKKDADSSELAGFLLGRPLGATIDIKAAAPFAIAWLCRWFPGFADLEWKQDEDWNQFVSRAKNRLGENLSLAPMSGRIKTYADDALETLREARESLAAQTDAAVKLENRIAELEPLEGALKACQKKNDQLEERMRNTKKDLGSIQRQVNEFQGKMPIDHDELMRTIKDAINDGLKGLAVSGGATAGTAAALAEAEMPQPAAAEAAPAEDEWGFKSKRKKNSEW